MIFSTDQDNIDFSPLHDYYTMDKNKWGLKLSGGADSALVLYMMVKFIQDNKYDVDIITMTAIQDSKPYNRIYAEKVIAKVAELTGYQFKPENHYFVDARTETNELYIQDQESLVQGLIKDKKIDVRFAGITANPSPIDAPHLFDGKQTGPCDDRSKSETKKPIFNGQSVVPLINTDKRGVADLYSQLGITNTLFPVTRSCEGRDHNNDFSTHCGECWFCQEREWGFGRLI